MPRLPQLRQHQRLQLTLSGSRANPDEAGPFFHGTTAALAVGNLLTAGRPSNYRPDVIMNHVYFTSTVTGAALAAELAEQLTGGAGHVHEVVPQGAWEDDPNVTDQRFPGNPTRSYRSREPLRIVREVVDWPRLDPAERQAWNERLAALQANPDARILND